MAWYMVFSGEVLDPYGVALQDDMYMVWPGGHGMVFGMVYRACYDMVRSGGHGIVNGMAWWASHGICTGLARYGMVYVIVWWGFAWYGLSGMT